MLTTNFETHAAMPRGVPKEAKFNKQDKQKQLTTPNATDVQTRTRRSAMNQPGNGPPTLPDGKLRLK